MENEESLNLIFWISTSIMLLLASGFMFITLIYLKKTSRIKQKESENLLKATLDSEKRERERIASDLHDSVKGDISALKNYSIILDSFNNSKDEQIVINEIKIALDALIVNVNVINFNLIPPLLQSEGFIATLRDYFIRIEKLNSIETSFYSDVKYIKLDNSDSYQLFRIIQELTTNSIKHSLSKYISLGLFTNEDVICVEFKDKGHKFDFLMKY